MVSVLEISDKLWSGEVTTAQREYHPFAAMNEIEEMGRGVAFYKGFSNITVVRTDEGLVLIDTGSFHPVANKRSFDKVRSWSGERVNTAVYTHGHVDHAYGLPPFLEEAEGQGWPRPEIIGHRAIVDRMDRYIATSGYNSVINERQFGHAIEWPTDPIYPTRLYDDRIDLSVGGKPFQLSHGKGETDDHTWVFLPDERILCTGDLFIWSVPNAGNPQKVQRYVIEWVQALRAMAKLAPKLLLPGHGVPIAGEDRVREALLDTAEYLESLYNQTLALMNDGARIDDIIHEVKPPAHLVEKPYLRPIYDEPEFVVRNLFRCFGGWYGGVPSELKPAPRAEQANEIAALAGGVENLLARASDLLEQGNLPMACHLADWAAEASPDSAEVHKLRAEIYGARTDAEASTMSKGIFGAAARESGAKS